LVALAMLAALAGCSKKEKKAKPRVEPMSAAEKQRGVDACTAYVERLCRCAETRPELKESCALVRTAQLEALRMAVAASNKKDEDAHVRWRTQVTARRIIQTCFEENNRLDPSICPVEPPPASTEPTPP
jgi:hypothetical protein